MEAAWSNRFFIMDCGDTGENRERMASNGRLSANCEIRAAPEITAIVRFLRCRCRKLYRYQQEITMIQIVIAALFALLIAGCSADNPIAGNDPNGPLIPLNVGNRWISRVLYLDSNGVTTRTEYDTLLIHNQVVVGGEVWYGSNRHPDYYLTNRADGVWSRPYGVNDPYELHYAKYPGSVGDVFGTDTIPMSFDPDSMVIVSRVVASTSFDVDVPAGHYRAIKYTTQFKQLDGYILTDKDIGNYDDYFSFVPNVGPVLEELFHTTASGKKYVWYRMELMEALIN
jgi:hypothetical protein